MSGDGNIKDWLEALDLGKYVEVFIENDVDLDVLPDLGEGDLAELGVSLGHRKKILRAVAGQFDAPARTDEMAAAPATAAVAAAAEPELRQLTVMFVDLVGSTALSRRLDPEDMRDVLRTYQNAVSGEVTRFDGYVAHYMGDGVLAYFGWPKAYEDQAERAVHAALGVLNAVRGLRCPDGMALEVRIGIASGQVVVGDLIGEGSAEVAAVTGETPNLAARLQEFAKPGQIVLGDATRRLIGNTFELQAMGNRLFKGFAEPIPVWRLLGVTGARSRFEAVHGGDVLPIVGRKPEIGLLLDRWELAKSGNGQAVFVSGEAGIGKSRLVQALREEIGAEPHFWVRCQASPYHTASALYPMARQLEQAAGFDTDDSAGQKRLKLEQVLRLSQDDFLPHLQALAPLLSIPLGPDDITQTLTADQLRERTIEALIDQLVGLSRRRPALFIFEDAHWMDPSTQDAIMRMTDRISDESVVVVITHRPEWQPDWATGYGHAARLSLARLNPAHAAEIARAVAGDGADGEMIRRIAARTDGVPLYIEELARSIFEAGGNAAAGEEIPETLQGLLLARLDRLEPEVRELAQVGAVIGREFTRDLLGEILDRAEDLEPALQSLIASQLVHQRGPTQSRRYVFRHALIQEAAYNSLLVRRRQSYHQAIAEALERDTDAGGDIAPELIAQHFSGAGNVETAVSWWIDAGRQALERSANVEAVKHFQRGMEAADELPEAPKKLQLRLKLSLGLGDAEVKAGGLQNAVQAYAQAARLARLAESEGDLTRAAIGYEVAEFYLGNTEQTAVDLLQEAASGLRGKETVDLARVLASLGRANLNVGYIERAHEILSDAVDMAHRLGDKRTLFEAIFRQFYAVVVGPNDIAGTSLLEIHALAKDIGDWDPT